MDPLTALGLAANVFACVSFTSDLIKGAIEISTSPNGCSADVSKLDSVYNDLRRLCTGLEVSVKQRNLGKDDQDYVVQLAVAIEDLSEICKKDCNDLLQLLLKFKTKTGLNGKWSSFRVALRTVWGKKTIDELEQRLSKTQHTLTLHICILAHYSCRSQSNQLEDLQRQSIRLQSNQADTLKCISKKLDDVEAGIKSRKDEDIFTAQDVDCLKERLQSLSLSGHDVAREQSILQSLTFDSRPIRHEQIPKAHAETFKWALKKDPNHSGSMIGEWLAKGTGILWIAGKPGSGKSTLMKFIADSRTTSQLVSQWAQPSRAFIASHYFWIAGTPKQKSHQGLLQSLLYDIFRQCPYLIQETCSHRRVNEHLDDPWSLSELHETLKSVSCRDSIDPKFCFFVDGMDEFDGDHEAQTNLCRTLKELATLENVKLVLSSRPWNIFEEQFGSLFPKLYVQDLTHDDIQAYAQSSLQEHPRWPVISGIDSQRQFLISEITKRSEGVFLWVRLVMKLLKQGLTNRDRLSDLYRRLQSFPTELESFFKAILESVEPFYHSHMSTILQVALQAGNESLGFLGYHFHIQEYEDLNYALNLPIRLMDQENIQQIKSDMTWHLDSRTRGLLEVHSPSGTVNFLHRTVRDFLRTREMHDFLVAKVNDRLKFNPVLSLLKAYVALIKVSCIPSRIERVTFAKYTTSDSHDKESQQISLRHLWNAMSVVETLELDAIPDPGCRSLLDELDRSL
ncbi:hypothetical protein PFICI_01621 [Pestalotiopsis fici W106-1]|uniref:Uncharacterized protein n=1 Tax=Pestalotiopsis fici (strain W106-1 / CGMCC3.15140) TaxID=1229662 RepID=W3XP17_PESFW|nr:uncharacterized protein PFICI_01621 [Pestalotiopsis fici W106-1]ETS87793.1 hypothetical protein PFICI_01621 [Pestalotiopsis fici W106-1]